MPRGIRGDVFNRIQILLLTLYTAALAPFIKLLPWLLMCAIVDPTDANEERKLIIATIVKDLFRDDAKTGDYKYQSVFRSWFDVRRCKPWGKKFVEAFAVLIEAMQEHRDTKDEFDAVHILISEDISAGLHVLMNGNPNEKKSNVLVCAWKSRPDDVDEIPVPNTMALEIRKVAIVAVEYLLHYQGAGDPKSTWCAMRRFFELWKEGEKEEKTRSYAPYVATVMYMKKIVKDNVGKIVPGFQQNIDRFVVVSATELHRIRSMFGIGLEPHPVESSIDPTPQELVEEPFFETDTDTIYTVENQQGSQLNKAMALGWVGWFEFLKPHKLKRYVLILISCQGQPSKPI